MVTGVPPADQALVGLAEALRLHTLGEPAREAVSGLGERWLDALVSIEDHPAVLHLADRRLHLPEGGLFAFPQGFIAPTARAGSDPEPRR